MESSGIGNYLSTVIFFDKSNVLPIPGNHIFCKPLRFIQKVTRKLGYSSFMSSNIKYVYLSFDERRDRTTSDLQLEGKLIGTLTLIA